jgi:hypothetical protein
MARKASAPDARVGRTLWIKDHGGWRAIVVQAVVPSVKGPKVQFRDQDRQDGQCLLTAYYRSTHS